MLAAAAAAGLLLRKFLGYRASNPQDAETLTNNLHGAATMVGAVAQIVVILLKALWGTPVATNAIPIGGSRFGSPVGEAC